MSEDNGPPDDGHTYVLIFCKYVRRGGKIIYPKNGKCFRFWVKVK